MFLVFIVWIFVSCEFICLNCVWLMIVLVVFGIFGVVFFGGLVIDGIL